MYGSEGNWKYSTTKVETGWTVMKEYVGPPAMVREPPNYELLLDDKKHFVDLRRH
jgi:hypothetical protein